MSSEAKLKIGVVAIGRNEGERLERCLKSLLGQVDRVVYVDSGSTDRSIALAKSLGVEVVELDMSQPFTMARGRNVGFAKLVSAFPDLEYVQFIDGDCELVEGWIDSAREELDRHSEAVVVCGRRRERYPDASIYNRLTDMEWDGPVGEVTACGGDAMMRVEAFQAVGGFNGSMIAGEEPELCVRLRYSGGKIIRLPIEMTLHDAAMERFGQWWKRTTRAGHAYVEGAAMHGRGRFGHNVRQARSVLFWGGLVPMAVVVVAILGIAVSEWAWVGAAVLAMGYPVLVWRVYRHRCRHADEAKDAFLYAVFCVLGKLPQAIGVLQYSLNRLLGRRSTLIEYKGPDG